MTQGRIDNAAKNVNLVKKPPNDLVFTVGSNQDDHITQKQSESLYQSEN